MNILVVEDDVAVNQLLSRRLEREGHTTKSIVSARELINSLGMGLKVDLMLLDYNLTDMDASQIITRLKSMDRLMPFIVCTGVGSESIAVNMMKEGARDYLVKDKSFLDVLVPTVNKVLKELKIEQELETVRKKLIYQNAILAAVHELSLDGVIVVDDSSKVVSVNKRFSEMWGLEDLQDGVSSLDLFEKISHQLKERGSFLTSISNVGAIVEPFSTKHHDLELNDGQFYELYSTPMGGSGTGVDNFGRVWYFRDVTMKHQAHQKLENARNEALKTANLKAEFLANFSHEVRTPLNSLVGFLELLKGSELNSTQNEYLQAVIMSCDNLCELINNTLDLSKLEAGAMSLNEQLFDIYSLFEESVVLVNSSRANKEDIELIIKAVDLPPVLGDAFRLKQVIVNLLSNALKFTSTGKVELKCESLGGHRYKFQVIDTGVGIAQEKQKQIFEAFQQEDVSVQSEKGGTGLGLSISARIVRLMQGELSVTSELGQGSCFEFELYLKPIEDC
jgi:two-component system, sensor histidine kinase and response regulator